MGYIRKAVHQSFPSHQSLSYCRIETVHAVTWMPSILMLPVMRWAQNGELSSRSKIEFRWFHFLSLRPWLEMEASYTIECDLVYPHSKRWGEFSLIGPLALQEKKSRRQNWHVVLLEVEPTSTLISFQCCLSAILLTRHTTQKTLAPALTSKAWYPFF